MQVIEDTKEKETAAHILKKLMREACENLQQLMGVEGKT